MKCASMRNHRQFDGTKQVNPRSDKRAMGAYALRGCGCQQTRLHVTLLTAIKHSTRVVVDKKPPSFVPPPPHHSSPTYKRLVEDQLYANVNRVLTMRCSSSEMAPKVRLWFCSHNLSGVLKTRITARILRIQGPRLHNGLQGTCEG